MKLSQCVCFLCSHKRQVVSFRFSNFFMCVFHTQMKNKKKTSKKNKGGSPVTPSPPSPPSPSSSPESPASLQHVESVSPFVDKFVIGEGQYGCIHKPSLHCRNKRVNYKNTVSKILEKNEAKDEFLEYEKIANIDKYNDFFLGKPRMCLPKKTQSNTQKIIKKCKNGMNIINNIDNYKLMILKDGGINLEEFAEKIKNNGVSSNQIEHFWIEVHRLFKGLKLFNDNGFVHNDTKPQNILYDETNNRLNFIDFGLSKTKNQIIQDSIKSKYSLSIFWWSFPLEMNFFNKNAFEYFFEKENNEFKMKNRILLAKLFMKTMDRQNYRRVEYNVKQSFFDLENATNNLFSLLENPVIKKHPYVDLNQKITNDLNLFLSQQTTQYDTTQGHLKFLEDSVSSIDSYGLGISLIVVLASCFEHIEKQSKKTFSNYMSNELCVELFNLFYDMMSPFLPNRLKINQSILKYEEILTKYILPKYKKQFVNHVLVNKTSSFQKTRSTRKNLKKNKSI